MAGQIKRIGKNIYDVRVQTGTKGQRRGKSQRVYGTLTDAEAVKLAMLTELSTGHLRPLPYTVEEWLQTYLDSRKRISPRTRYGYEQLIKLYLAPLFAFRLTDIAPPLALPDSHDPVIRHFATLEAQGLSAKTLSLTKGFLSAALGDAANRGLIPRNPCLILDLPPVEKKIFPTIGWQQVSAFLAACRQNFYGPALAFMLVTGARPSEMMGLGDADIELPSKGAGVAYLRRVVSWRRSAGGGWDFRNTKTARANRPVIIPETLVSLLREHRARQLKRKLAAGAAWEDNGLFFASQLGTPLMDKTLRDGGLKKILQAAKITENITSYGLRRSFATLSTDAGMANTLLQQLMGHHSAEFTQRTYVQLLPGQAKEGADLWDERLRETG